MLLRRERDQRGHVPGTTDVLLPTYPLYVDTRGPPAPSRAGVRVSHAEPAARRRARAGGRRRGTDARTGMPRLVRAAAVCREAQACCSNGVIRGGPFLLPPAEHRQDVARRGADAHAG